MNVNSPIIIGIICVYLLAMVCIGIHFSKRDSNQAEFLLGGKKLPGWALALSERSTNESAWMVLAASGMVYSMGMESLWLMLFSPLGSIIAWLCYAKPFMKAEEKYHCITTPGFFAARFGSKAKLLRWLLGTLIMVFFTLFLAAQVAGAGTTLSTVLGVNEVVATILVMVVVVLLSRLGGFTTVVWTDMIQALLMLAIFIILPIAAYLRINELGIDIPVAMSQVGGGFGEVTGGKVGGAFFAMFFGYASYVFVSMGGSAQLNSRYFAMRDGKELKQAKWVASIWVALAYIGVFIAGILARLIYGDALLSNTESVVPYMVTDLMPPWVVGILISAILAAIISTADSQLILVASALSEDVIHYGIGKSFSQKQLVNISKWTCIVVGAIALIFALVSDSLIFTIVSWYVTALGIPMSIAVSMTFFWKKVSSIGIIAVMCTGTIVLIVSNLTGFSAVLSTLFTSACICTVVGIVVSLLFPDAPGEAEISLQAEKEATK